MDEIVSLTIDDLVDKINSKLLYLEGEMIDHPKNNDIKKFHSFITEILESLQTIHDEEIDDEKSEYSNSDSESKIEDEFQESEVDDYEDYE